MMEPRCDRCKWWDEDDRFENDRPCHRNPPVLRILEREAKSIPCDLDQGIWPITGSDDWCGEFCFKDLPIDSLKFSSVAINYLRNMGVNTLKELLNKSDDDLLNHSKMTNKTLNSIIKTLLKSGYELKDAT